MKKEYITFNLKVGAMAIPVGDQLGYQGISIDKKASVQYDKYLEAVSLLGMFSFLTESEVRKARNRIIKALFKEVNKCPSKP